MKSSSSELISSTDIHSFSALTLESFRFPWYYNPFVSIAYHLLHGV